jgi:hypothetical protein
MNKKSLLIIGTQRSGSNLLRLMLNQLDEIVAPHPPHILQNFFPLLDRYGDLCSEESFRLLIEDVCRFVELNPVPWTDVVLRRDKIRERCQKSSLVEVFKAVYETAAEVKGASAWCCKSMANLYYIPQIEASGLEPVYIHLFRDGRDVAMSFKKTIVGEKHSYNIARQWSEEQELCLKYTADLASSRTISVRYEDLISAPEEVMKRVCSALQIAYSDKVLQYHQSEGAKTISKAGEMWTNVARPVIKTNSGKYLKEASKDDIEIFETVAGKTLLKMGYALSTDGERAFTEAQIEAFNSENARLKKEVKSRINPDDLKKRAGQESFLNELKQRAFHDVA